MISGREKVRKDRGEDEEFFWRIHADDLGAMRPAIYRRRHKPKVSAMSRV